MRGGMRSAEEMVMKKLEEQVEDRVENMLEQRMGMDEKMKEMARMSKTGAAKESEEKGLEKRVGRLEENMYSLTIGQVYGK